MASQYIRLYKSSERTVKCQRCGDRNFYWYHIVPEGFIGEHANTDECRKVRLVANGDGGFATQWVDGKKVAKTHKADCTTGSLSLTASDHDTTKVVETVVEKIETTIDPDEVRRIVRDELSGIDTLSPDEVRRIAREEASAAFEYITPSGFSGKIEGLVHKAVPTIAKVLGAGLHDDLEPLSVWAVGPAGTGKTTLAGHVARILGIRWVGGFSCSPDKTALDLVGYRNVHGDYVSTAFRDAYENGGLFLLDEADNTHPSILASLNQALAQEETLFPDGLVQRHNEFRCIVAANTDGSGPDRLYPARQRQDFATLDRFVVVRVDIDTRIEDALVKRFGLGGEGDRLLRYVRALRAAARELGLPVDFTPRASAQGAQLLALGLDWEDVIDARVRKGITDADWQKLTAKAGV
jgi:cobaltochelatase CobS